MSAIYTKKVGHSGPTFVAIRKLIVSPVSGKRQRAVSGNALSTRPSGQVPSACAQRCHQPPYLRFSYLFNGRKTDESPIFTPFYL